MTGQRGATNEGASTSKGLKQSAPVLDYDLDLEYWENPEDMKIPQAVPTDAARFWVEPDRIYTIHDVSFLTLLLFHPYYLAYFTLTKIVWLSQDFHE